MLTLNVLAFIACLYIVRGRSSNPLVVDALAMNWLACQAVVSINSGYGRPEVFIAFDLMTGIFLAAYVQGAVARNVASIFIPMFFINGSRYIFGSESPPSFTVILDVLAWSQLVLAYIGGQNGALAPLDSSVRRRRGPFADTIFTLRGRK